MTATTHIHPRLDDDVQAIGGHYVLTEEKEIRVGDRTVLYALGTAELDSACCGMTGCHYAVVAGYLLDRRYALDEQHNPLSRVERISDAAARAQIRSLIESHETVTQVTFR